MKYRRSLILAGALFAAFLVLILLVKVVDVQDIGPEGTSVGFATLNGAVHDATVHNDAGYNPGWYKLTSAVGYLSILLGLLPVALAVMQFIGGKSIKKVDIRLLAYVGMLALLAVAYVFFEVVIVNYRPAIVDVEEGVEASFPSSHTMLSCTIMGGMLLLYQKYLRDYRYVRCAADAMSVLIILIMVVGRFLSGVHWLTDIVGGVLISAALVLANDGVARYLIYRRKRQLELAKLRGRKRKISR